MKQEVKKILVIDDDKASCELLEEILRACDWATSSVQSPEDAFEIFRKEKFHLVISDVNLGSTLSGIDILKRFRESVPVILITGFGSLESAIESIKEGAFDFISKPFKVEEIVSVVKRAMETSSHAKKIESAEFLSGMLVGRTPIMIELYKEIARAAMTRSTVLITGESGTGKELVAKAIHQHSLRKNKPFVAVNCGALTETLLEAELFGHSRGAFTGAVFDRRGLWEEADGGTLFLDEIGETSLAMQVKLLRAIQEGEIRRVGSSQTKRVDVRVIAATNKNLEEEVKKDNFREDLFYRLSVITIHVPPLRERVEDIPLLAEKFLREICSELKKTNLSFSEEAIKIMQSYEWRGNVRELQAVVEYAALRCRGQEILPEDLPVKLLSEDLKVENQFFSNLYLDLPSLDELEKRYLIYVLEKTGNNRTKAAEILGIDRRTLYRMAERFGIQL
ncbi:MAG: sigma-54 dependent transcriptional regulator [Pyrinomonadaceae bacterium]|nr:sigma-54 dependent transcriptional regulator [Pyrinomonadaceae bacterium]MCX7640716.1 sigma-54 dependent transcriptional regulator [Pyrinomonadaceae bacterium]MDW8305316.1 sigma-54 dependent transcriptional regulator [Acidobacteriota bacterium]